MVRLADIKSNRPRTQRRMIMETRTITQVRIYTLALNPMAGRAEERRIVALSTDYNKLVAWYRDQMVPEWRDGLWYKYFRQGSPLEW